MDFTQKSIKDLVKFLFWFGIVSAVALLTLNPSSFIERNKRK